MQQYFNILPHCTNNLYIISIYHLLVLFLHHTMIYTIKMYLSTHFCITRFPTHLLQRILCALFALFSYIFNAMYLLSQLIKLLYHFLCNTLSYIIPKIDYASKQLMLYYASLSPFSDAR